MDFSESTRIVFDRVQKLEPEHFRKIMGYILLHDIGEQEMIRLAFGPDRLIFSLMEPAKIHLGLAHKPAVSVSTPVSPSINPALMADLSPQFRPYSPLSSRHLAPIQIPTYWDSQRSTDKQLVQSSDFMSFNTCADSIWEDHMLISRTQHLSFDDQLDPVNSEIPVFLSDSYGPDSALSPARAARRSPCLPEFPGRACVYFNKGFCKHGSNCKYSHGQSYLEGFSPMFGPNSSELVNEDQIFLPGSLERLEIEIIELLKSRRGNPVSIASLPLLYYEKYGKVLQADGYLTESQRHGKAGYSLTKLLARLKNSIRLIDRPHGQHAVVLVEDAPKYMENWSERSVPGPIVSGSRQIYLTFPADSTFTEEDVSNYFMTYGPVEDVRIPCQQKRMFGFVTFVSSDTVNMILSQGNPHFVCGARVLVKPYREKSKLFERKYLDKTVSPVYFPPNYADINSELVSRYEVSRLQRRQLIEEQERSFELERGHLAEQLLFQRPVTHQLNVDHPVSGLKISEDAVKFPSPEQLHELMDVLKYDPTSDDKTRNPLDHNYANQESSQGLNLPESPFTSPIATSFPTVM